MAKRKTIVLPACTFCASVVFRGFVEEYRRLVHVNFKSRAVAVGQPENSPR
jgi:hypothetical protein